MAIIDGWIKNNKTDVLNSVTHLILDIFFMIYLFQINEIYIIMNICEIYAGLNKETGHHRARIFTLYNWRVGYRQLLSVKVPLIPSAILQMFREYWVCLNESILNLSETRDDLVNDKRAVVVSMHGDNTTLVKVRLTVAKD